MKVILVTKNKIPISVNVGRYCFGIVNELLDSNEVAEAEANLAGKIKDYEEAYNVAAWAWVNKEFDAIENN